MIILQGLIRFNVIPCEELTGESSFILALSFITCVINIFVNNRQQAATTDYMWN